jgi:hypothetical protein
MSLISILRCLKKKDISEKSEINIKQKPSKEEHDGTFEKYFGEANEEVREERKDTARKRIKIAFDSYETTLEEEKLNAEDELKRLYGLLANGKTNALSQIMTIKAKMKIVDETRKEAELFRKEFLL